MNIEQITYTDSALDSGQTDIIVKPFLMVAVGFVIYEDAECVVLAQELVNEEFRGQLAIPKVSIVGKRMGIALDGGL